MNYQLHISPGIEWNTDISCFNKIVSNLISNAFKYTPDKGIITIELKVENQSLIFVYPILERDSQRKFIQNIRSL